eukprot:gnl/MRDRNA2_/MRDRNA2_83288_c0_seq1.p1 gnl/MRDRNA2_/MRDRNA2_83288_c0~~gnl/MRDRNA2_/MRDRNA2_83288_c0_seq1.p1  ORF type:complete len:488 (-),score=79.97 gnl/MRDRNA2_/MRDRNA2_83288_c0_seq1:24-1430(-)
METLRAQIRWAKEHVADHLLEDTLAPEIRDSYSLIQKGDLEGAEVLQRDFLAKRALLFRQSSEEVVTVKACLARTLQLKGDFAAAEEMQRQVLEQRQDRLGHQHPNTLTAQNRLAQTLLLRGECIQAYKLLEEVLEARRKLLVARARLLHADPIDVFNAQIASVTPSTSDQQSTGSTLTSRSTLQKKADLTQSWESKFRKDGSLEHAEILEREAIAIRMGLLGSLHPETLAAKKNLAITLGQQGKSTNASRVLREIQDAKGELLCAAHDALIATGDLVSHPSSTSMEDTIKEHQEKQGPTSRSFFERPEKKLDRGAGIPPSGRHWRCPCKCCEQKCKCCNMASKEGPPLNGRCLCPKGQCQCLCRRYGECQCRFDGCRHCFLECKRDAAKEESSYKIRDSREVLARKFGPSQPLRRSDSAPGIVMPATEVEAIIEREKRAPTELRKCMRCRTHQFCKSKITAELGFPP